MSWQAWRLPSGPSLLFLLQSLWPQRIQSNLASCSYHSWGTMGDDGMVRRPSTVRVLPYSPTTLTVSSYGCTEFVGMCWLLKGWSRIREGHMRSWWCVRACWWCWQMVGVGWGIVPCYLSDFYSCYFSVWMFKTLSVSLICLKLNKIVSNNYCWKR